MQLPRRQKVPQSLESRRDPRMPVFCRQERRRLPITSDETPEQGGRHDIHEVQ